MVEPDTRPELVLRRHLETRDGPVEAHILHLQQTFQVEDLSPDNLVRISEALGNAQILVDPPLEEVSEDGRLMLSIAPGTASPLLETAAARARSDLGFAGASVAGSRRRRGESGSWPRLRTARRHWLTLQRGPSTYSRRRGPKRPLPRSVNWFPPLRPMPIAALSNPPTS